MKKGHIPIRTCIGCRTRRPGREMIRLKCNGEFVIISRPEEGHHGRGCYVCPSEKCLKAAMSKGRLMRALRTQVTVPPLEILLKGLERRIT